MAGQEEAPRILSYHHNNNRESEVENGSYTEGRNIKKTLISTIYDAVSWGVSILLTAGQCLSVLSYHNNTNKRESEVENGTLKGEAGRQP